MSLHLVSRAGVLAAAGLLAIMLAPRAPAQDDSALNKVHKPTRLFASDSAVAITIATDLKAFMKNRDSTADYAPATVRYTDEHGTPVTLEAQIKSRGHFRRQKANCDFPPVRLKVSDSTKGTLFAKQGALKLVTPCNAGRAEFEQYIRQEYLIYRVYNLITPLSFRARLVNVTYEDTKGAVKPITTSAFFVEDDKDMAARNGGQVVSTKMAQREDLVPEQTALLSMFEFLIANTDWSIPFLHNIRLVKTTEFGKVFPVPYDFDWSGVVNARYARPDPQLPIRTVDERLYRGYCTTPADLAPAIATFNQQKSAIYDLYRNSGLLDAKTLEHTLKYYDDFYKTINDAGYLKYQLGRSCMR